MNFLDHFLLTAGFIGFTLVLSVFLAFVPFYRTLVGTLIFCGIVNFWLILLLALGIQNGWFDRESSTAGIIRGVLYPCTAVTGFALFGVVLRTQHAGRKERNLESSLFNKRDVERPKE